MLLVRLVTGMSTIHRKRKIQKNGDGVKNQQYFITNKTSHTFVRIFFQNFLKTLDTQQIIRDGMKQRIFLSGQMKKNIECYEYDRRNINRSNKH